MVPACNEKEGGQGLYNIGVIWSMYRGYMEYVYRVKVVSLGASCLAERGAL